MGVVSNKINIMELMKSGGGGDPTIPGRVSALETETAGLIEANAKIMTSVASLDLETAGLVEANAKIMSSVAALDLESVALAEGLQRVMTSVSSGAVPMQTGNKIRFGVDGNGDYGYYKAGADTVTPFLTGGGGANVVTGATVTRVSDKVATIECQGKPLYLIIACTSSISTSDSYLVLFLSIKLDTTTDTYSCISRLSGNLSSSSPYIRNEPYPSTVTINYDGTTNTLSVSIDNSTSIKFPTGKTYTAEYIY